MLDPVEVAYRHHAPTEPAAVSTVGVCCRCGQTVPVQSISSVVSAKFTGFDLLGAGDGLCRGCAWAFSTPARRLVLSITATAATLLDTASLFDSLLRPSGSSAIVVPLSGRKHVLPYAQWGTVRVDDINLTWQPSDVHRLRIVADLRLLGAPATSLPGSAPPARWLTSRHPSAWEAIDRQWRQLDAWRPTPHLDLAIKATHHLKGTLR